MKAVMTTNIIADQLVADGKAEYISTADRRAAPDAPAAVAAPPAAAVYAPNTPPVIASATPLPLAVQPPLPGVVARDENGVRVDQPCAPGTPGTVTLEKTGHTLSLPQPNKEMFAGYCQRVWRQADGNPTVIGALFQQSEAYFARFGGFKVNGSNWPQVADYFFDTMAGRGTYQTDEERTRVAEAQAAFRQNMQAVAATVTPPAPPAGTIGEVDVPIAAG